MTEDEITEDETEEYDDSDEDTGPDYYECFCCGYSCVERPAWGGQCPKCSARMEEGYY